MYVPHISYYWSKHCLKMFSKAGFEGREGKAVMESKRKGIPDLCSREAEGTTTMLVCF